MKQCRLSNILESVKPDVVIGTETWLDGSVKDSEIFPKGYRLHRKDRETGNGGGVLIAIKEEFNSEDVPELDASCEVIWARIKLVGNGTVYLCSYYRYHVSDDASVSELESSIARARTIRNATLVIGGDFNFPGWDWKTKTLRPSTAHTNLHLKFSEILDNNGLTQIVEDPTRKNNILDLIITNQPSKVLRVDVIPGISDHDAVFTELDMRPVRYKQKPRQIPLYRKANWELIRKDMASLKDTIHSKQESTSVDDLWILFRDTLQASIRSHIPHRQSKTKDGYPWIGPELKRLMRRQQRYYKLKKKTGDPQHIQQYLELKHQVQKFTRQAYWKYVEGIVTPGEQETEHTSMKRFWTYIKHKRNDNVGISSLKGEGRLFSHPVDKAELLNKQFQCAFSSSEEVTQEEFSTDYSMPTEENQFPVLDNIDITLNGITKLLKDLNPNKSPGPDNLGPRVLKELAEDIAPILLVIFQKSLDTGEIPEDWRTANVTPVYKKGEKYQPENYRPISLTSVCCKIMEHVIASQIMNHGETNNILYPLQHGFRRGRSCETQLIEFIDDLSSNLQENQQTDVLVMDFA
ncbi:MAG: endonuclease/exonuclease/phosphatase family protein, partial [Candidatus Thiodiazotropha sp.]